MEILNANDNLPAFKNRVDLMVSLNEVGFHHELMCMNMFECMMLLLSCLSLSST